MYYTCMLADVPPIRTKSHIETMKSIFYDAMRKILDIRLHFKCSEKHSRASTVWRCDYRAQKCIGRRFVAVAMMALRVET